MTQNNHQKLVEDKQKSIIFTSTVNRYIGIFLHTNLKLRYDKMFNKLKCKIQNGKCLFKCQNQKLKNIKRMENKCQTSALVQSFLFDMENTVLCWSSCNFHDLL